MMATAGVSAVTCQPCSVQFTNAHSFCLHLASPAHLSAAARFCAFCNVLLPTLHGLDTHLAAFHGSVPVPAPPPSARAELPDLGEWGCVLCQRPFGSRFALESHNAAKHDGCPPLVAWSSDGVAVATRVGAGAGTGEAGTGVAVGTRAGAKATLSCADCTKAFFTTAALTSHLKAKKHTARRPDAQRASHPPLAPAVAAAAGPRPMVRLPVDSRPRHSMETRSAIAAATQSALDRNRVRRQSQPENRPVQQNGQTHRRNKSAVQTRNHDEDYDHDELRVPAAQRPGPSKSKKSSEPQHSENTSPQHEKRIENVTLRTFLEFAPPAPSAPNNRALSSAGASQVSPRRTAAAIETGSEKAQAKLGKLTLTPLSETAENLARLYSMVHTKEELHRYSYQLEPLTDEEMEGMRKCLRCKEKVSKLHKYPTCSVHRAGSSMQFSPELQRTVKLFRCCSSPARFPGCVVYDLHDLEPFSAVANTLTWHPTPPSSSSQLPYTAIAIDCEMGTSTTGSRELIQLVAADVFTGTILLSSIVRPTVMMANYNTRFSGITPGMMRSAITSGNYLDGASGARTALWRFISPSTILVGQGLKNDLRCLQIYHPRCIDTEIVFPRVDGYPSSLKALAAQYLHADIQNAGKRGHDCEEDALAARELLVWAMMHEQEVLERVELRKREDEAAEIAREEARVKREEIAREKAIAKKERDDAAMRSDDVP